MNRIPIKRHRPIVFVNDRLTRYRQFDVSLAPIEKEPENNCRAYKVPPLAVVFLAYADKQMGFICHQPFDKERRKSGRVVLRFKQVQPTVATTA